MGKKYALKKVLSALACAFFKSVFIFCIGFLIHLLDKVN